MTQSQHEPIKFDGEEAGAGYAAPKLDLIAAAALIALSAVVLVASFRLPVPGDWSTAPGLLPILTAGSLAIMAIALGLNALKRHRAGIIANPEEARDPEEDRRALALAAVIAIYIAGLQFLAFRHDIVLGGTRFTLSAFEPVTILALTSLIHMSWRGPLWITLVVSTCWTLILSVVFQKLFQIPLPGGF